MAGRNSTKIEVLSLFKLHDQQGIPLSISLMLRRSSKGIARFFFEALAAGWNPDTALSTIEGAMRDNEMVFDRELFLRRAAAVWTLERDWTKCAERCH
jgi:hypothetical protein